MNLVNKLPINYRKIVDIVNPFFFWYSAEKEIAPIFALGHVEPITLVESERSAKVGLSANPENININIDTMGQQKELKIFNKGQLFILENITEIKCTTSLMTGCYEFEIRCSTLTIGGNINE